MRRLSAAVLGLGLFVAACGGPGGGSGGGSAEPTAPPGGVLVRFGEATLAAEVVYDTPGRQRGLMERERLDPNAGMLFLFPRLQNPNSGFWMKNTLIPLGIAFLRRSGERNFEVLVLRVMEPCQRERCPVYAAGAPYDAALEVNEGWFRRNKVRQRSVGRVEGELPNPV